MTELVVTGGRVLRPDVTVERADVLIDRETGEITAVEPDLSDTNAETLDAEGCVVMPGLVNSHCHMAMSLLRGYADEKPLDAWLAEEVGPVEAVFDGDDVAAGTRLALVELLQSGVTAVGDMYFYTDRVAEAVREAGIRACLGFAAITVGKNEAASDEEVRETVRTARELDGAADGRIRTAVMPHALTTVDPERLADCAEGAADAGVPLHFHANETRGEVEPILDEHDQRPLAFADDRGLLREGSYVAHAVHVTDEEIDLLAERNVGVAHNPAANAKLASGMAPVQRMLDRGVTVGIGTDGPASNDDLDVFGEIRDAAMIGKLAADDATAVDARTVLQMATANGADLLGFDAGRVEVGRKGDLAVVDFDAPHLTPDHDPVKLLAYAARANDVRHTVCGGRVLVRDGEVVPFDAERVRREAAERAAAAGERAEE